MRPTSFVAENCSFVSLNRGCSCMNPPSSFIVNVKTTESVSRGIFSLKIHVLFRLNNIASMLFSLNNTWIFRLNMPHGVILMVLTFTKKDELTFELSSLSLSLSLYIYIYIYIYIGVVSNTNQWILTNYANHYIRK